MGMEGGHHSQPTLRGLLHLVLPMMERSDLDGWLRMNLEKVFLHGFHPIHGLRLESFSSTEPSARNASPFGRRERAFFGCILSPVWKTSLHGNLWNVFFQEKPFVVKVLFPHGINSSQKHIYVQTISWPKSITTTKDSIHMERKMSSF